MPGKETIRILITSNDIQLVEELKSQLAVQDRCLDITVISCSTDAVFQLDIKSFDVVVLDLRYSRCKDASLLGKLKRLSPMLEVIVYSYLTTADTAIKFLKMGVYDFLAKPCSSRKLAKIILNANEKKKLKESEKRYVLEKCPNISSASDRLIGQSDETRGIRDMVKLVAPSDIAVLILGETGTGKDLVAKEIHAYSTRSAAPLVVVNASVLQEYILESELFGYKKGAFTGAQSDKEGLLEVANHGTCFIDEVGDMGLSIQTKLLRVIETGVFMKVGDTRETKVDVRFLFATNKDISSTVEHGGFRKDLFYRINAFTLKLPSLRERRKDIIPLANHFLERFSKQKKCLSMEVEKFLTNYSWPGNVRELANVIQRSILFSGTRKNISFEDLPENVTNEVTLTKYSSGCALETNLSLKQAEQISKITNIAKGNKTKAVRLLGISRPTLYRI